MADGPGTSIGVITLDLRILNSIEKQIGNIAAQAQQSAARQFEAVGDTASKAMQKPLKDAGTSMEKAITEPVENAQKTVQNTLKKTQDQVDNTISKVSADLAAQQNAANDVLTEKVKQPTTQKYNPNWKPLVDPAQYMADYEKDRGPPDLSDTFKPAADAATLLQQKLGNVQMQLEAERQKLAALNAEFARVAVGSKAWDELSAKITAAEGRLISLQSTLNATQAKIDAPAQKAAAAAEKAAAAQEKAAQRAAAATEKAANREQAAQARVAVAAEAVSKRSGASMGSLRTQANAALSAATSTAKGMSRLGVMGRSFSAGLTGSLAIAGPLAAATAGFLTLRKAINLASINSDQFKKSLNEVKANLQVAFTPIYQAILPALNSLMAWLAAATKQVAVFVSALFGKTYAQSVDATKKMQDQAAAASKAAGGSGSKNQGQLASFDELNVIGQKDSGSAATGGIDYDALNTKGTEAANGLADKFKAAFDKINVALAPTKAALAGLQTQLQRLGSFAWSGLKDFYSSFLVPVGKWALGTGLPGFIAAIKDGMANINWGNINGALHDLWLALAPFAINVGTGLLWFWQNVLVPLGTWTMNVVVPAFLKILADAIKIVNGVLNDLKPLGQWLFDNFLKPLAEWTGGKIADILNGIHEALSKIGDWIVSHQKAVQDIAVVVGSFALAWGLVNAAMAVWNAVGAIATGVTAGFGAAVAVLTSPITLVILAIGALIATVVLLATHWDQVKAAGAAAWDWIKNAWNAAGNWFNTNVVQPVANFFTGLWNGIKTAASTAWQGVSAVWKAVATWFNGTVVTPIANFFGNLWDGIKAGGSTLGDFMRQYVIDPIVNLFKGMYNSVVSIMEGVVNGFVGIINGFIRGINRVTDTINKIPGVHLGSIGTLQTVNIPRLANGGVLTQPTLAMMGEYPGAQTNPEVAAPQSVMLDTFMQAIVPMLNELEEFRADIVALLREIIAKNPNITLDGVTLARLLKPYSDEENKRVGGKLFDL